MMRLSCCVWALTGPDDENLTQIAEAGFKNIDLRPFTLNLENGRIQFEKLDLRVSCLAASFGMPEGISLDSENADSVEQALSYTSEVLDYGVNLGAETAYVVPGGDGSREALDRYTRSLCKAADQASSLGLKLCIEHFPGCSLPTASKTLDFIKAIDHPNLYLLLDIGHAQMTDEDPADVIANAGARLGYVHLDDNDGNNDLHWSLTDGVLTEDTLRRMFSALKEIDYAGAVSLELNAALADPLKALIQSREIVIHTMKLN